METRAQAMEKRKTEWRKQMQSSFSLLKHFPKSIFRMLYTIWKLRKSRIQRLKRCMIWSWNEEDMAFGRQLEDITPQTHHEDPPCENFASGFRHIAKFLWIPCFETLLMLFHCRFSKIFCLIFSFVNTYFTLVINQWKGCFCNSSCNLAFYCL